MGRSKCEQTVTGILTPEFQLVVSFVYLVYEDFLGLVHKN